MLIPSQAFVSYLRSVHLQKDKSIFDVTKLPAEAFAASLGLPGVPKIKFLSREQARVKKNASRDIAKLQDAPRSDDEGDEDDEGEAEEESEEESVKGSASEEGSSKEEGEGEGTKGTVPNTATRVRSLPHSLTNLYVNWPTASRRENEV